MDHIGCRHGVTQDHRRVDRTCKKQTPGGVRGHAHYKLKESIWRKVKQDSSRKKPAIGVQPSRWGDKHVLKNRPELGPCRQTYDGEGVCQICLGNRVCWFEEQE